MDLITADYIQCILYGFISIFLVYGFISIFFSINLSQDYFDFFESPRVIPSKRACINLELYSKKSVV